MKRPTLLALIALLLLPAAIALAAPAIRIVPYPYESVWPAAVRFLRIDRKLKIVEKDESSGYVLFEISDDGKTYQGALELSRTKDSARRAATRLSLDITGRPGYVADALLEKFEDKLSAELGEPAPPPPPPAKPAKPPESPDAGPESPRK